MYYVGITLISELSSALEHYYVKERTILQAIYTFARVVHWI